MLVSLGPGGRSGAFKPNGIVAIYVLEGELELRSGTGGPQKLAAGQGTVRLQGTPMNLLNVGGGTAKYLAFFLVPAEQTLQTVLPNSP